MKVVSVVGARPQFIKAFAVSRRLRRDHEELLVHTGQHYDEEMSDVFFEELDIPEPDYNLGIGSDSHGRQTAAMIREIERVVDDEDPDAVLVYGDTNSTLAASIVASKTDATLAHVEAGLRSYNRSMPEEINRVLTDHASDVLFAPTHGAVENLRAEGRTEGVHRSGDVMFDSLLMARERALESSAILEEHDLADGEYILATVHRAGNTDDPEKLEAIFDALGDAPLPVVLPLHPRTEHRLDEYGLRDEVGSNVRLIEPAGYLDFVRLLDGAAKVATDSGGVQKEAFFLDTPCITLREETEWVETVDAGWNVLVGADGARIREALTADDDVDPKGKPTPYGEGDAAAVIVDLLAEAVDERSTATPR